MHTHRLWGLRARRVRDGKPMGQSRPIGRPQSWKRSERLRGRQCTSGSGGQEQGPHPGAPAAGGRPGDLRVGAYVEGMLCLVCRHPWGSWRPGGWEWIKGAEAPGDTALGLADFRPLMPSQHQGSHPHFRGHWQESGHGSRKGHSFPPPTPPALSVPWGGAAGHRGSCQPSGAPFTEGETGTQVGDMVWFCLVLVLSVTGLCSCHPTSTRSPGPGL